MLTHYIFRVLVFEFKIIDVPYFMDECTYWEIDDLVDYLPYIDRTLWESQRLCAYVTAQVNSKKKLTQQDICKFPWEENHIEDFIRDENATKMSDEDIKRLKNIAKQWEHHN